MPLYEYKAYDSKGRTASGLIDAPSVTSAHQKLKKQGFYPISISEDVQSYSVRIPVNDMVFALEELSTLLKAGVPMAEALETIVEQISHDGLKRAFARVKVHLEEGDSLASSLAIEQVFPPTLVRMVEAGESVGAVETILDNFASFIEKESEFKEKVFSSLLYPTIIMVASISLIIFVLTYIAPTLVKIFTSFHANLPLSTSIMLAIGNFLRKYIFLLIALVILSPIMYFKIPKGVRDNFILQVPVIGVIQRYIQMSRWCRTLAMLLDGGVSLIKALESSRDVVENKAIQEELKKVEEYVQKGEKLSSAISKIPNIPPLIFQMIRTGEKSGNLEKLLNTSATFFEKEVNRKLSLFLKFLEPAMIIFLGLVVGFVAISALLPIFEINKLIK